MTVNAIREYFVGRADWADPERTVDQVIIGDGDKEVSTCLVTWISSFSATSFRTIPRPSNTTRKRASGQRPIRRPQTGS